MREFFFTDSATGENTAVNFHPSGDLLCAGKSEYQRDGQNYMNLLMISGPFSDSWEYKPNVPNRAVQAVCTPRSAHYWFIWRVFLDDFSSTLFP